MSDCPYQSVNRAAAVILSSHRTFDNPSKEELDSTRNGASRRLPAKRNSMFEVSHFPAPTAGLLCGTVLLLAGSPHGWDVVILSIVAWTFVQYSTATTEAE